MANNMDDKHEDLDYLMEPPQDLHELYMRLRMSLSKSRSFFDQYKTLLALVDNGSQLLPNKYNTLKDEIMDILEEDSFYPQKRQIEKEGNVYHLSSANTGRVTVRAEDLSEGRNEVIEQQTSFIIPKLKKIDNQIFRILTDEKIIDKKRQILEDLLIEQTMTELSNMIRAQQR